MALNESLLRRLIETPGVPGREEKQREIAREELGSLADEVHTDALGSVIGTKKGSGDARVMVAAHTDEIGYLVKHIDDKGFVRLQTVGDHVGVFVMYEALRAVGDHGATIFAVATSQEEVGLRGAAASGSALEPTVVVALDITIAMDVPGGGNENTITELGKGAAIKIMDSSLICHPKLIEHFRRVAEREGIAHQMEILPQGGTDSGGVQRLHGGIPSVTLSIPTRYVHTPNEMVNASDVEACIDLLARYLEEAHTGDYAL